MRRLERRTRRRSGGSPRRLARVAPCLSPAIAARRRRCRLSPRTPPLDLSESDLDSSRGAILVAATRAASRSRFHGRIADGECGEQLGHEPGLGVLELEQAEVAVLDDRLGVASAASPGIAHAPGDIDPTARADDGPQQAEGRGAGARPRMPDVNDIGPTPAESAPGSWSRGARSATPR